MNGPPDGSLEGDARDLTQCTKTNHGNSNGLYCRMHGAVEFGVVPQYLHMSRGTAGDNHSFMDMRAVLLSRADFPEPPAP